jgi:hypothetical protein
LRAKNPKKRRLTSEGPLAKIQEESKDELESLLNGESEGQSGGIKDIESSAKALAKRRKLNN